MPSAHQTPAGGGSRTRCECRSPFHRYRYSPIDGAPPPPPAAAAPAASPAAAAVAAASVALASYSRRTLPNISMHCKCGIREEGEGHSAQLPWEMHSWRGALPLTECPSPALVRSLLHNYSLQCGNCGLTGRYCSTCAVTAPRSRENRQGIPPTPANPFPAYSAPHTHTPAGRRSARPPPGRCTWGPRRAGCAVQHPRHRDRWL